MEDVFFKQAGKVRCVNTSFILFAAISALARLDVQGDMPSSQCARMEPAVQNMDWAKYLGGGELLFCRTYTDDRQAKITNPGRYKRPIYGIH